VRHHHEKHDRKYPVFVFIHGGSYYLNSGSMYSPEKLAAMGMVVVTFNYRLGLLGTYNLLP
jgi:para-nitrobenzyl esterase